MSLDILDINEDVQVQVALSLYLKGALKISADIIAERKDLVDHYVNAVRILLRVPKDKSFESASIYAGNLTILVFEKLLKKNHNEILQEIVLKVFRSRTPSVIQSLVLVYARLINQGTTQCKFFITQPISSRALLSWKPTRKMLLISFHPFPFRIEWG